MKKILLLILFTSKILYCQIFNQELYTITAENPVTFVKLNNNGRFLAAGYSNGFIKIFDNNLKKEIQNLNFSSTEIKYLLFDSENKYLISADSKGLINIIDLYTGKLLNKIEEFRENIQKIEISPDNKLISVCGESNTLKIYDLNSSKLISDFPDHSDDVIFSSFSPNGDHVLAISKDNKMYLWDINKQKQIRKMEIEPTTIKNSGIEIMSVNVSPDKYFICFGIQEHALQKGGNSFIIKNNYTFYEWSTGKELVTIQGNNKEVSCFAICPDKNYLIADNSTLRENKISFWNIQKGIVEKDINVPGEIRKIDISENGKYLVYSYEFKNSSAVIVNSLSGINGYSRFNQETTINQNQTSNFGGAIKITTTSEPLISIGEKKKLAILYFDPIGVEEQTSKTATNLLESKLSNSNLVTIVERNQIDKVLSELKYQLSGFTSDIAIDIGKQLNANYMLIGSVNKLGNLVIITCKLVNNETAQVEGTREVQCTNATIENISDMVALLASTIVKLK